jgi:hypothetical protein
MRAIRADVAEAGRPSRSDRERRRVPTGDHHLSSGCLAKPGRHGDKLVLAVAADARHPDDLAWTQVEIDSGEPLDAARVERPDRAQ